MVAMPAARKCGKGGNIPGSPAEWGGDAADRELVLLHAILSFGLQLPQQTAVSRNERNMAVVFKSPTPCESALNTCSDGVVFLKTTSHLMPLWRPERFQRCLKEQQSQR